MTTRILAIGLVALWAATAEAHKPSDSYVTLQRNGDDISGRWDIALRDLDHAVGLDANADGAITWGEVRRRQDVIANYALTRLELRDANGPCALTAREHLVDRHSDGAYAVLRFAAACPGEPDTLTIRYRFLFDLDPQHRGVLRIGDTDQVYLFGVDTGEQRIAFTGAGIPLDFWRSGIRCMSSLDQLLFLAALLLPATLRRGRTNGHAGTLAASTLKVVAAFTLAHSLTLTLATQHSVALPTRLIALGIPVSILVAAASHPIPVLARRRWMIAFAFGLLHGFDLASAFTEGSAPITLTARDLLSFNLGLETGQLLFVGMLLLLRFPVTRLERWRALLRNAGQCASTARQSRTTPSA